MPPVPWHPVRGAPPDPLPDAGHYLVLLRKRSASRIPVGRRGEHRFPAGWYGYVGRARRGLGARVRRHVTAGPRRLHWHIDYFLACTSVRPEGFVVFPLEGCSECGLAARALAEEGASVPVPGFGASDCRGPCPGHLVRFRTRRSAAAAVRRLRQSV